MKQIFRFSMHDLPNKIPTQALVYTVKAPRNPLRDHIKISKPAEETYDQLICTPKDIATVQEIVTIVGENNKFVLFIKQGYIRELGSKITNLHPLKFMTSIFCYPHLKGHMIEIFGDYFKRNEFMNGLAPRLSNETQKGKLAKHLPKFAEELGIPIEKMQPYFDRQEWEALCEFIIKYKK